MPPVEDDSPAPETTDAARSLLDQLVEDCELAVRTMNVCQQLGITTVRALFESTPADLERAKGFHRNVVADVGGFFDEHAMKWPRE
jgi:DNA-directed RNA polymerase alpha subunit